MLILGIDTSCDDTGVAVVENGSNVLSNVIASQYQAHNRFGGIVPVIAAREHTAKINYIIESALIEAGVSFSGLDAVAVSHHQGLMLSLVVGVSAAKSISLASNIPLIGIHHLEGHIYSNLMGRTDELHFPFLCLTVAGGHTLLLKVIAHGTYELLGHTRDDAAGEVLDKVARHLGLGYPGGAVIEKLAQKGDPHAYDFPRPLMNSSDGEFSFSGLKTAVIAAIDRNPDLNQADLCASFQQAIIDLLVSKTMRAAHMHKLTRIALAGGVALNQPLRATLKNASNEQGYAIFAPPKGLCMDNGAMIAGAAYHLYQERGPDSLNIETRANAPLGTTEIRYRPASKYE
ncbi:MAG: tRNA (adenosine(37)-N6)-threonylcarbamoyltransferase complex transferase subunit TsaD [Bacteroidetes bacterium]|nr:tRNA (adenosine(37)-N6)-threonylcarbamoyltransferase complex transferase subunit TsaD [Bacteroidota bacterium]MCY4204757.1 tRNA (adenosine(37)-N6)-threonylcarbamoyltransferase complex transferase subunit TsaD [Bacteroidota bacterium]